MSALPPLIDAFAGLDGTQLRLRSRSAKFVIEDMDALLAQEQDIDEPARIDRDTQAWTPTPLEAACALCVAEEDVEVLDIVRFLLRRGARIGCLWDALGCYALTGQGGSLDGSPLHPEMGSERAALVIVAIRLLRAYGASVSTMPTQPTGPYSSCPDIRAFVVATSEWTALDFAVDLADVGRVGELLEAGARERGAARRSARGSHGMLSVLERRHKELSDRQREYGRDPYWTHDDMHRLHCDMKWVLTEKDRYLADAKTVLRMLRSDAIAWGCDGNLTPFEGSDKARARALLHVARGRPLWKQRLLPHCV